MSDLNDAILGNIDIVDVVGKYVKLKRVGRNFVGICPFHNEKTPSFSVSSDKQIYKCFGCGEGGNVIKFLMEVEKIEYWDAINILAKDANVDISKYKITDKKLELDISEKEKIKLINKYCYSFFVDCLNKSSIAQEYIYQKRKLTKDIVEKFGIGYAPDSHYELIKYIKSKGFNDDDIISAGLAKKGQTGDLYSFFRNRIMFPIYDHMSNIVAFTGRALSSNDNPKYLNTPETIIFDKSKVLYGLNIAKSIVNKFDKLILVEGQMDVIALYRANYGIGIASSGTAFTEHHLKLASRYTKNIIFAFDNDNAGFDALIRGLKLSFANDIYPRVMILPNGFKDIDEYVNSLGEDFSNFVFDEIDGFEFIFNKLIGKLNLNSPVDRKKILNILFELLKTIKDNSILMFYIEYIANKLKINFDILFGQFKTFISQNKIISTSRTSSSQKLDKEFIFASIFYDNFLSKNIGENSKFDDYIDFFVHIGALFENSILQKVFDGNLNDLEIQKLKESQLFWEKQIEGMNKEKKINQILLEFNHKVDYFYKQVSLDKSISQNYKNEIFEIKKKLLKK